MAPSLRDRFFTRPVARAITSPSGILAAGAGTALGVLAFGNPIGAIVGGVLFYAARVGLAIPRGPKEDRVDPFALDEPWRRLVQGVVAAEAQYREAVGRTPRGPIRERLEALEDELHHGVRECWQTAYAGHALSEARRRIDAAAVQRELDELHRAGYSNEVTQRTEEAIRSQLDTAARMDSTITATRDQLRLLAERLDDTVTRAIELSASSSGAAVTSNIDDVGVELTAIGNEMEALRQGLDIARGAGGAAGAT